MDLSNDQIGFLPLPGLLENVTRLEGVQSMSGQTSKDVCIAFLDISKAFDNVGHEHLKNTLRSAPMPMLHVNR